MSSSKLDCPVSLSICNGFCLGSLHPPLCCLSSLLLPTHHGDQSILLLIPPWYPVCHLVLPPFPLKLLARALCDWPPSSRYPYWYIPSVSPLYPTPSGFLFAQRLTPSLSPFPFLRRCIPQNSVSGCWFPWDLINLDAPQLKSTLFSFCWLLLQVTSF